MVHEHGGHSTKRYVDIPKVISSLVGKDDVFLDIWCGPGDYLKEAHKISGNVLGFDKHAPSIEAVRAMGIKGIISDVAEKFPLEKASVDSILMANVLHGFVENGEAAAVLSEVLRVLKNGGLLGVVEFKKETDAGPPREIKLSPKDVEKILLVTGFSKVSEQDVGPHHYLLVFRKK